MEAIFICNSLGAEGRHLFFFIIINTKKGEKMKVEYITEKKIEEYCERLICEEKSKNTVEKYKRDLRKMQSFFDGRALTKELVLQYKQQLCSEGYAPRSINSMLAAANSFFEFCSRRDLRVRSLRVQREIFAREENELTRAEYLRLVRAARERGRERLCLLLQTICSTGIRVSELCFVTVEALRRGRAIVSLKGKTRTVLFVAELQKKLLRYAAKQRIKTGIIFLTRSGKPLCRTNIWREMKSLCLEAEVEPQKVFPTI